MLQVVCDRCHRELDPSRMESDDYSLTVYAAGSDEPVIAYEDLCDDCMEALLAALRGDVKVPSPEPPSKPKAAPKAKKETSAKRPSPRRPRPEPRPEAKTDEGAGSEENRPKGGFGIVPDITPVQDGKVVARKPVRHVGE